MSSYIPLPSTGGFFTVLPSHPTVLRWSSVRCVKDVDVLFPPAGNGASVLSRKLPSQTAVCASRKINRNTKNFIFWIFERVIVSRHLSDTTEDFASVCFSALPRLWWTRNGVSAYRRVLHVALGRRARVEPLSVSPSRFSASCFVRWPSCNPVSFSAASQRARARCHACVKIMSRAQSRYAPIFFSKHYRGPYIGIDTLTNVNDAMRDIVSACNIYSRVYSLYIVLMLYINLYIARYHDATRNYECRTSKRPAARALVHRRDSSKKNAPQRTGWRSRGCRSLAENNAVLYSSLKLIRDPIFFFFPFFFLSPV